MSDFVASIFSGLEVLFYGLLFLLWIVGISEIVLDDHRYTSKDVVIAAIVFPYPWWVGSKVVYRYMTTTSEEREIEEKCLDASEGLGMPRKSRVRFCDCYVETQDSEICKVKIFGK